MLIQVTSWKHSISFIKIELATSITEQIESLIARHQSPFKIKRRKYFTKTWKGFNINNQLGLTAQVTSRQKVTPRKLVVGDFKVKPGSKTCE